MILDVVRKASGQEACQPWTGPKVGTVTGSIAGSLELIKAMFSLAVWCEVRIAR